MSAMGPQFLGRQPARAQRQDEGSFCEWSWQYPTYREGLRAILEQSSAQPQTV